MNAKIETIVNEGKTIRNMTLVGIIGNIVLSAFKLFAGVFGMSAAMISDAVHSFSDVVVTLIAYFGVKISRKEADSSHQYGYDKYECVISLLLGSILAITGLGIGYSGLQRIISGDFSSAAVPTVLPLIAALVSIAGKEAMYRYTMHYAKKIGSSAFAADAWHHRSDAVSSIGAFIGIGAARMGFPVMDSVAGVLICLCILKMAFDIYKDALKKMVDTSCGEEFEREIQAFTRDVDGIVDIDMLHTRMSGNRIYIDMDIAVDSDITLMEAHSIAERIHDGIEREFQNVKHVMVHVNPACARA